MLLRILYFSVAFLLSWLPESARQHRGLRQFNNAPMNVVSGICEITAVFAIVAVSFFRWMDSFTFSIVDALTNHYGGASVTQRDLTWMGSLGFVAFLVQPASVFCYVLMLEGTLRSLSALLTDRSPGTFLLAVPFRVVLLVRRRWQDHADRMRFGPAEPDELLTPETTASGFLEVRASREQPWHDRQVLEHEGRFYILSSRDMAPRGKYLCICYRFRPMNPGEIIRGSIAHFSVGPTQTG